MRERSAPVKARRICADHRRNLSDAVCLSSTPAQTEGLAKNGPDDLPNGIVRTILEQPEALSSLTYTCANCDTDGHRVCVEGTDVSTK